MKQVDIKLTENEGHAMRALANSIGPGEDPIEFLGTMIEIVESGFSEGVDPGPLKSLKQKLELARFEIQDIEKKLH